MYGAAIGDDPEMASDLPELVRVYAERSAGGDPRGRGGLRLRQIGEMVLRQGARPRRFAATEELEVHRVAFTWDARFPLLGPLTMRVADAYDGTEGRLDVSLLGLPLRRERGPELARGEAFRYLAEIAWVPEAILANPQLCWQEIDERTIEVATTVLDDRIAVRLIFDEVGDVVRTVAERPRLEAGGATTTWIGEYADHRRFGGMRLPARGEVHWELAHGPFVYWRGTIVAAEPVP